ncbi:MAG: glycosyltransferase family 4 protein [Planctomycetes bacterium]|nr:glycosyltransferase family 4 protein [Planctomycetota bacterium]
MLRHRDAEIVHLNSAFDRRGLMRDVWFVGIARLLGKHVVIKFHGSDLSFLRNARLWWRVLRTLLVRRHTTLCVLSQEEREAFVAAFPRAHVVAVKNALDLSRYERADDVRPKYSIPPDKPVLLFVARFIESKGLHEVLRALPMIREQHDVHAVLVGDGPVRAKAEEMCRQLRIESYATFTGYVPEEETVGFYRAASLLLFPTYHQEGMPMVIFHSLACGLPIVTTRIRAAADWLEDGVHCRFVPPRNPHELARATCALLDDPALRRRMGANGRALARTFDRRTVAGEFLSLYESITPDSRG